MRITAIATTSCTSTSTPTSPRRRWRELRWYLVAAVAALALGLGACTPVPVVTSSDTPESAVDATVLTRDGSDQFFLDRHGNGATVSAPLTNTGENTRAVFFARQGAAITDAMSCTTWVSESTWSVQEGVALRIAVGDGVPARAITVTKNVFAGATWLFNVHVWDAGSAEPTQVGAVDLGDVLSSDGWPLPLPWRLCARVVDRVVELKAWRAGEREPSWGDRRHGGSVVVERQWVYPGRAGWYVGHLPPGGSVEFSGLGVAAAGPAGDPARAAGTFGSPGRISGAVLRASR